MESITVQELSSRLQGEAPPLLIDVRTSMEFASGHVAEAINVPLSGLAGRLGDLKDRGAVHVICQSGNRSAQACALLANAKIPSVNVSGGTSAWSGAGLPVKAERSLARLLFPVLACVFLGLAPFSPEPHLVGKIRWVAGGAVGMGAMDWFDLVMHGAPFLWLAWVVLSMARTPAD